MVLLVWKFTHFAECTISQGFKCIIIADPQAHNTLHSHDQIEERRYEVVDMFFKSL